MDYRLKSLTHFIPRAGELILLIPSFLSKKLYLMLFLSASRDTAYIEFARFLGNLYFAAPSCTITVRNSYFELYGIGETVSSRNSYRIASPLFSRDREGSRLLQESTTSGCFEPDLIYPIIEGKLKELALKKYSEMLPDSVDVTDVGFSVTADDTIWSSAGDCKNIRIIFDEKLVYSMTDSDEMTVEELAALPFSTLENRQELLLSLSESDAYFSRFGQLGELIVTDPALPTRMPSSKPSAMPSLSLAPSMEPSDILSETPSFHASTYPSDSVSLCLSFM